jgi:Winged helix-turn-helix DNA-binding
MSLLDQVRKLEQQVVDRLTELEPLTREYEQLRKVAQRLGIEYSPRSGEGASAAKPSTTSGRGRGRAGAGKRAARTPAKTRARRSAARPRAAKRAATSGGARSPAAKRAASRAAPAGAGGMAAPSRPRKRAGSGGQRPGRRAAPARPGQRDDDMLRLAGENPGITVREIGERLGVDATGLYRVAKRLTDAGRLRKDGPRLYPAESATAPPPAPAGAGGGTSQPPSGDAVKPREATARPASEPSTNADDGAGSSAT